MRHYIQLIQHYITLHNTILEGTTFVVDKDVHDKKVKTLKSELLGVMSEISAICGKV